ncbi:MAG TPA: hypothetical protein VGE29_08250 [Prosthecobacter sp.]
MSNPYQSPSTDVHAPAGRTVVTDIDIPFGRLIMIMLKFMLASIPAVIVMYVIMFGVVLVFALFFGGLGAIVNGLNPGAFK